MKALIPFISLSEGEGIIHPISLSEVQKFTIRPNTERTKARKWPKYTRDKIRLHKGLKNELNMRRLSSTIDHKSDESEISELTL